jgi:hypothetical protein
MDDILCRHFFLEPSCTAQRQYEALRAVFVEHCRQKEVAERFGYDYAAFRQLVAQFRAGCANGQPPPFFTRRVSVDRLAPRPRQGSTPNARPRPTAAPSA